MLKMEDIRGLSVHELEDKARNLKKDLMQLRFQAKTGKLEQQTRMRLIRRDIARIQTIITEKKKAGVGV